VDQDTEIVPIDAKISADLVLVAFFKEHSANDSAISLRHFFQDFAHLFLHLLGNGAEDVRLGIRQICGGLILKGTGPGRGAVLFQ